MRVTMAVEIRKESSPLSSKHLRHSQRKYRPPRGLLSPLSATSSLRRHDGVHLEELNTFIDDIAERYLSPDELRSVIMSNTIVSPLPPLQIQPLQRPRLFLQFDGHPIVVTEQLVRFQEYSAPKAPPNALQLATIPKKCMRDDELALMPCHSLQNRGYELLSAEFWREPVRDRYKHWVEEDLLSILREQSHKSQSTQWSMTRAPGSSNRGKWRKHESYKLHSTSTEFDTSPASPAKRPPRLILHTQGVLISRSYCVLSIFGEGIYGRLYGAGLTGKDKARCLHVEAYEPSTSQTYFLRLSLQDIEWVFRIGGNDAKRVALLAPGRKQALLRQLVKLLYFEYRGDLDDGDVASTTSVQVLRISPDVQVNQSALRQLEREKQLRQEESQRLAELAALRGKPRRLRYRVVCQTMRLRGRQFYASIYHFPSQPHNLVILTYNPSTSMTYRLTISLVEAASFVDLYPYPQGEFSPEQTLVLARNLLPRLRLHGYEGSKPNARMFLAINGGRKGLRIKALPLLAPMSTDELTRDKLINKMQRNGQRVLQLELEMTQLRIHEDAETERVKIREKIAKLEVTHAEATEKDQKHTIRIEEINATGGKDGPSVEAKRLHEERRALKTARQALKAHLKVIVSQRAELDQQLQVVSDKELTSSERAKRRVERARERLHNVVLQNIAATLHPVVLVMSRKPVGQRTWLARAHMRTGHKLLASGGERVFGKRVRYSLFAQESEINANLIAGDVNDCLFSLELYDPSTCSRCSNFVFSKLEWLALTKSCHEQQQLVPGLALATSEVAKRFAELHERIGRKRQELCTIIRTSSMGRLSAKITRKKRDEIYRAIAAASNEIHRLNRAAPWSVLVKAVCERCSIAASPDPTAFEIILDRCIFHANLPLRCITSDKNEDGGGEGFSTVHCHVQAKVLSLARAVVFEIWDPLNAMQWHLEYPDSRELLREIAIETFAEQRVHLEVIIMSMMLRPSAESGCLELCFEE